MDENTMAAVVTVGTVATIAAFWLILILGIAYLIAT